MIVFCASTSMYDCEVTYRKMFFKTKEDCEMMTELSLPTLRYMYEKKGKPLYRHHCIETTLATNT